MALTSTARNTSTATTKATFESKVASFLEIADVDDSVKSLVREADEKRLAALAVAAKQAKLIRALLRTAG